MSSSAPTTTTNPAGSTVPLSDACCTPGSPATYPSSLSFPPGKDVKIADVDCYSVNDAAPDLVVISTDIFGHTFPNTRQNADQLAAAGFHVVIPDLFAGDAATPSDFQTKGMDWLRGEWFPRNPQDKTAERLVTVIKALQKGKGKGEGEGAAAVKSVQAVGYCYGAVGVLRLYKDGLAASGVVAHPTGFNKDNVAQCTAPTLFLCAEHDQMFPAELRQHWEGALKERMQPAKFVYYPGTTHGFAVRDNGQQVEVDARQAALQETIAFLKQGASA